MNALKLNEYLPKFRASKLQYDETQSVVNLVPGINTQEKGKNAYYIKYSTPFVMLYDHETNSLGDHYVNLYYAGGKIYVEKIECTSCFTESDMKKHDKWILERLDGLVDLPPETQLELRNNE